MACEEDSFPTNRDKLAGTWFLTERFEQDFDEYVLEDEFFETDINDSTFIQLNLDGIYIEEDPRRRIRLERFFSQDVGTWDLIEGGTVVQFDKGVAESFGDEFRKSVFDIVELTNDKFILYGVRYPPTFFYQEGDAFVYIYTFRK